MDSYRVEVKSALKITLPDENPRLNLCRPAPEEEKQNKQELPQTVALCKEIHQYLRTSNTGQKNTLGLIMQIFISALTENDQFIKNVSYIEKSF